jgi:hypothetical protein
MFAIISGDTKNMVNTITREERANDLLFGNDDDRGIHVHMNIYCLVCLECKFQPSPSLFAKTFQSLTGNTLHRTASGMCGETSVCTH